MPGCIMKWKVSKDKSVKETDGSSWFILKPLKVIKFEDFINDVLGQKENEGKIQIQAQGEEIRTLTYGYGVVSWVSDEYLKNGQMNNYIFVSGRVHKHIEPLFNGTLVKIDFHIFLRR